MIPIILGTVVVLLSSVKKLIEADGDSVKEDEALMEAQEAIKAALDKRKFGS